MVVSTIIIHEYYKERRIFIPRDLFESSLEIFKEKTFLCETGNYNQYSRCYLWREINNM